MHINTGLRAELLTRVAAAMTQATAAKTQADLTRIEQEYSEILAQFRSMITIKEGNVVDILGDKVKNFTTRELAFRLKTFLDNTLSIEKMEEYRPIVIIEHQPPKLARWGNATTSDSSAVAFQLMFYYCKYDCAFIDSKEKNKLTLSRDLLFSNYMKLAVSEAQRKSARKRHSTDSFKYVLATFSGGCDVIKPSLLNHIGDACMQTLAYAFKPGRA